MKCFEDFEIKNWTSLKIGGKVKQIFFVGNILELQNVLKNIKEIDKKKIRIIGGGTNLLIDDNPKKVLDLIIIKLCGDFEKIEIGESVIKSGAGVSLQAFIVYSLKRRISGMEILAGIPGTVGGAVFGNAGTKYGEISQFIDKIETLDYDGNTEIFDRNEISNKFEYRRADFLKNKIVCFVKFNKLKFHNDDKLDLYKNLFKEKISTQPYGLNNAGCIFKNPQGFSVGKIIDELGLKNFRIGNVFVSEKHANFIVADDYAHFKDFIAVAKFVQSKVKERIGIDIEFEIKIWD
jgi:UDP-N-acetylmuramate dehydrogenase